MGVWANISKRAEGTLKRREDNNDFWESGSYTGTLDSDTKELLHAIHDFKGFAPFLPEEILENKGDVKVYLDDACTRKENVTLAQLEKAQLSLEDELSCLKELLTKLQNSLQTNGREIENLLNRIRKIEDEIQTIKGIISRLRAAGKDSYTIEIELLG